MRWIDFILLAFGVTWHRRFLLVQGTLTELQDVRPMPTWQYQPRNQATLLPPLRMNPKERTTTTTSLEQPDKKAESSVNANAVASIVPAPAATADYDAKANTKGIFDKASVEVSTKIEAENRQSNIQDEVSKCAICHEDIHDEPTSFTNGVLHACRNGHQFHTKCLLTWRNTGLAASDSCPMCRDALPPVTITELETLLDDIKKFHPEDPTTTENLFLLSEKIQAMVKTQKNRIVRTAEERKSVDVYKEFGHLAKEEIIDAIVASLPAFVLNLEQNLVHPMIRSLEAAVANLPNMVDSEEVLNAMVEEGKSVLGQLKQSVQAIASLESKKAAVFIRSLRWMLYNFGVLFHALTRKVFIRVINDGFQKLQNLNRQVEEHFQVMKDAVEAYETRKRRPNQAEWRQLERGAIEKLSQLVKTFAAVQQRCNFWDLFRDRTVFSWSFYELTKSLDLHHRRIKLEDMVLKPWTCRAIKEEKYPSEVQKYRQSFNKLNHRMHVLLTSYNRNAATTLNQ